MLNKESSPNDLRLSDSNYRTKHAATRLPPERAAGGPRRGSVPQAPAVQ